ncbi:probable basic-leucine zipper transcription factor S [Prorops nasuta]|uniref:probable basic-leucine zipper transcription factor S n=1 Tax=Prorops nasuta TaxID=863751 RepID=UPI0034CD75A7
MKDKEHNSCLNMNNNSIIIAGSIKIQEEEKYTNSCNNSSGDIISLNDASQGSLMHNTTAASNFSVNLNKNVSLKSESMNIYGFNTHNCKKQDAAENANVHFNTTTYFENNQSINDNLSYLNITDKMSSNHDTLIYNLKGIENLCNDDTEQLAEYAENIMQNSFINESYSPNVNLYTADKSYINLDTLPIQGNNKQMVPNAANEKKVLKDINPYPNINIAAAKSIKPKIVEDKTVSLQLNQRMIDEIAYRRLSEKGSHNKENANATFSVKNTKLVKDSSTFKDINQNLISLSETGTINSQFNINKNGTDITSKNNLSYCIYSGNIIPRLNCDKTYDIIQNECNNESMSFHSQIIDETAVFVPQLVSSFINEPEKLDHNNNGSSKSINGSDFDKDRTQFY